MEGQQAIVSGLQRGHDLGRDVRPPIGERVEDQRIERDLIEALGLLAQRGIAAGAHIGDQSRDAGQELGILIPRTSAFEPGGFTQWQRHRSASGPARAPLRRYTLQA